MSAAVSRTLLFLLCIPLFMLTFGCQPAPPPTPTPTPTSKATAIAESLATPSPITQSDLAPTATAQPPTPTSVPLLQEKLTGALVLIDVRQHPNHKVTRFDLSTQTESTLFDVPPNGWVHQLDIDQTRDQIALSYSAPPGGDQVDQAPFDRSGIYVTSLNEERPISPPQLLIGNSNPREYLFDPMWADNGASLFYVRYVIPESDNGEDGQNRQPDVSLHRYDLETERSTLIAQDGIWPRVSPNGQSLVYIQVDTKTLKRSIVVSDLSGKQQREIISPEDFFDVDTPHFSPDGEWIYFSAVPHSTKVERRWWEIALGIQVAEAHTDHNFPSDWWRVPIIGGEAERVTQFLRVITHGTFDSSGEQLFFAANTAIFSVDKRSDPPTIYQVPVRIPSRYVLTLD